MKIYVIGVERFENFHFFLSIFTKFGLTNIFSTNAFDSSKMIKSPASDIWFCSYKVKSSENLLFNIRAMSVGSLVNCSLSLLMGPNESRISFLLQYLRTYKISSMSFTDLGRFIWHCLFACLTSLLTCLFFSMVIILQILSLALFTFWHIVIMIFVINRKLYTFIKI